MTTHILPLERRTLHGTYSREREPVLTIESGDSVRFTTLDSGWHLPDDRDRRYEPRDPVTDKGHALCGPIAVAGAAPGMTLEVHINALRPAAWGWTDAGGWNSTVNNRLGVAEGETVTHWWTLDRERMTARNQHGHTVKLRPFMGVMGMPPDEPGLHATAPPRVTGGNIDCKELVVSSSLFLPIAAPLGLFSTGDGHGAHAGRITFGFSSDTHEAAMIALEAMLDWMGELYGLERRDALVLASLAVDLHVTQLVNADVRGVHAILPNDAIGGL